LLYKAEISAQNIVHHQPAKPQLSKAIQSIATIHNQINKSVKMKSFTAITLSLIGLALAAPSALDTRTTAVTIQLTNDQSGANSNAAVPLDGASHPIAALYAGSSIANGGFKVTSALLNQFPQKFSCTVKNNNGVAVGTLNSQHTYLDLDGNPSASIPTSYASGSITCS
jgi:opacity protein-like surface antigen